MRRVLCKLDIGCQWGIKENTQTRSIGKGNSQIIEWGQGWQSLPRWKNRWGMIFLSPHTDGSPDGFCQVHTAYVYFSTAYHGRQGTSIQAESLLGAGYWNITLEENVASWQHFIKCFFLNNCHF